MDSSSQTLPKRITAYICILTILCQPLPALADIVVDNTGGGNTSLDQAANGVGIVNIANPNANGISHNRFNRFNVNEQGIILNNSPGISQSQLGGYISGNANLQSEGARLILNEVTGNSRSELKGYTEIAGRSADYVLANPFGITCDGCGFINTPRVTLAAGTPEMENGRLRSFNIDRGEFIVKGLGLDARNLDRLDILARSAQINANLHAQNLTMILGNNRVDYPTGRAAALTEDAENSPAFALDVAALGACMLMRLP